MSAVWLRAEGEGVACGGSWTLGDWRAIAALEPPRLPQRAGPLALDLAAVERLDTVGALALLDLLERAAPGRPITLGEGGAHWGTFLGAIAEQRAAPSSPAAPPARLLDPVAGIGAWLSRVGEEALALLGFFGLVLEALALVVLRPWRLRWTATVFHMEATGLSALPIVGLLGFLIGIVIAYQGADQLRQFGAELYVVNLLGVSILRELGVLMTAIIVAGRSGSAFTAQIGTMKVNQEVDAMQTMGLDPIELLVLPRVIALMVTLPLLTYYTDMVALLGGLIMTTTALGLTADQFFDQLDFAIVPSTFYVGILKAPVFAFVIALVGCFQGLQVTGSAESVGRLTTQSVVQSIFLVITLDAAFSIFFAAIGW